jgi:hypothetical protein
MATTVIEAASARSQVRVAPAGEAEGRRWQGLYTAGGVGALITAVLIPIHVLVFIIWPPPLDGTVNDWFTLFNDNRLLGLLSMDLLLMADYVLLIPIVLALAIALRQTSPSLVVAGAACFFVAIAVYFASNTAVEMMSLSNQYADATTDAERAMYLAAGQAQIESYVGTAFHVNYLLGSLAGILIGIAMLRGTVFSSTAGYAAIIGNAVGLGLYLPVIGLIVSVISGLILWVWYILIGRTLLNIAQTTRLAQEERT